MAYRARPPVAMTHPAQWLAVIRIVVGLYFAKAVATKMTVVLLGGVLPVPAVQERWVSVMPTIVAKQAAGNPLLFYKHFLEETVLTHSDLFAHLTAWGEVIAGVGLTLGLLTGVASLVGADAGHQLRPGHAVDVAGPAGIPPRALHPDGGLLLCSGRAHLGIRCLDCEQQAQVTPREASLLLTALR